MAQEQVNVELNLVANAEAAIKELESKLNSLRSKKIDVPITFQAETQGVDALKKSVEEGLKTANALTDSYRQQSDVLRQQKAAYTTILSESRKVTGAGKGGARVLQAAVTKIGEAKKGLTRVVKEQERLNRLTKESVRAAQSYGQALKTLQKINSVKADGGFFDSLLGKLTLGGIAVEAFKQALQGVGDLVGQGIAFEQLNLSLEAFTGSSDNAKAAYKSFKETALKTPFAVAGVAQAGKTLLAFDVSLEKVQESTRQLAVVAGATGADLNNLSRNLGQINAQGRAYTRDLNQFATAGIPIYTELAKVLNLSVVEVRQYAEEGKIGFGEVEAALTSLTGAGSAFANLAARQLDTVAGQIGNVQTTVQELAGEFIKLYGPTIVSGLKGLAQVLELVKENAGTVGTVVVSLAATALLGKLVPAVLAAKQALVALGSINTFQKGVDEIQKEIDAQLRLTGSIQRTTVATKAQALAQLELGKAVRASLISYGKFALVAVAIAAVTAAATTLYQAWNEMPEALKEVNDGLQRTIDDLKKVQVELRKTSDEAVKTSETIDILDKNTGPLQGLQAGVVRVTDGLGRVIPVFAAVSVGIRTVEAAARAGRLIKYIEGVRQETLLWDQAQKELTATNTTYIQSEKKSVTATQVRLGQTKSLLKAAEERRASTQNEIALNKAELKSLLASGEGDSIRARFLEKTNKELNSRVIVLNRVVQGAQANINSLSQLLTAESLYQQAISNPILENRTAAFNEYTGKLEATTKAAMALAQAQDTLAKQPVQQLESAIKGISIEYDRQIAQLKLIRTEYDRILASVERRIRKEAEKSFGPEQRKQLKALEVEELQFQLRKNAAKFKGNQLQGEALNAALQENLQIKQRLALASAELKFFDQKEDASKKIEEVQDAILDAEDAKAKATQDTEAELINQKAIYDSIKLSIDAQVESLKAVAAQADVAATEINNKFGASLSNARIEAQGLLTTIERISKITPIQITTGAPNVRAAGGPTAAGEKYTVNELGKEAFLSAAGRLSMINAPAWGQWTAPSSGVVIPAHLTKMLNIPSGGVNLNKIPGGAVAGRSISTSRSRSYTAGDNIVNNVTIQSQQPVKAASDMLVSLVRQRRSIRR